MSDRGDQPQPIPGSPEGSYHPTSTVDEGSPRSDRSHRVHSDSRVPSPSLESGAPPRISPRVSESPSRLSFRVSESPSRLSSRVSESPSRLSSRAEESPPIPVPAPFPTQPTAERPASDHVPRPPSVLDLGPADDDRRRLEALNEAAERLHSTLIIARDAEERREVDFLARGDRLEEEFRHHEADRQHYFEEGEERRNAEARQRSDGIWQDLETRLRALPAPAPTPIPRSPSRPVSPAGPEDTSSIRDIAQQAASQHAQDILETVRLEREEAAAEREALAAERAQLAAELSAQKDAVISEKDARITTLEDELTRARAQLEAERQQRVTEDSETRDRQREELIERDENIRAQLGDITNLVQDQRDMCETKKALMDERWEQKLGRREEKNAQMIELRDMMQTIHDNMERDRNKCEEDRRECQDGILIPTSPYFLVLILHSFAGLQKIIDDLRTENAQQRELLTTLSEG